MADLSNAPAGREKEGGVKGEARGGQMIGALKQMEAGRQAEDVAREAGLSKHTI